MTFTINAPTLIRLLIRLNGVSRRAVDINAEDAEFDVDGTSFSPPAEFQLQDEL